MCTPINASRAISDSVPVEVEAVIVSVAAISLERAGIWTRGAAAGAYWYWSCFDVGADP
jgi:hypothetical protein